MEEHLTNHVEALIFCSPKPVTDTEIQDCLHEMFKTTISIDDILHSIKKVKDKFASSAFSINHLISNI